MRAFVVVVFDPISGSFYSLFEAVKLRTKKKLPLDAFPETLDFT
jgi:hypothetical protein